MKLSHLFEAKTFALDDLSQAAFDELVEDNEEALMSLPVTIRKLPLMNIWQRIHTVLFGDLNKLNQRLYVEGRKKPAWKPVGKISLLSSSNLKSFLYDKDQKLIFINYGLYLGGSAVGDSGSVAAIDGNYWFEFDPKRIDSFKIYADPNSTFIFFRDRQKIFPPPPKMHNTIDITEYLQADKV